MNWNGLRSNPEKNNVVGLITCNLHWRIQDSIIHSGWNHCMESAQILSFSGPYFPVFGLNTEIYGVNLPIQSEYRKVRTKKNSVFRHFSYSERFAKTDF